MAANVVDNFEDFFDFAALEHDNGLNMLDCQPVDEPFLLPDDVTTMDWAGEVPLNLCPADNFISHDVHMVDTLESFEGVQSQDEWPLTFGQEQLSLPHVSQYHSMASIWHPGRTASSQNPTNHLESLSALSPSSSFSDDEAAGLARCIDEEGLTASSNLQPDASSLRLDLATSENSLSVTNSTPSGAIIASNRRRSSVTGWKPASAKRKGPQSRIPLEAKQILEDEFAGNPYPCSWELDIIAHQANLDVKKVRNWYNNTRARKKGEGKFMLMLALQHLAYVYRSPYR